MKIGVLLLNLGTPENATPEAVGEYLTEFLMDPFVVDIPAPLRWFLVNVLIVPRRKHASAEAYAKIWTERDSPLRFHTEDLGKKVSGLLGDSYEVRIGMRYGSPSIRQALEAFKAAQIRELRVLPLYPQYAWASTRSSEEAVLQEAKNLGLDIPFKFTRHFFDHPGYIDAFRERIEQATSGRSFDHLLFSYHGLPERQIRRANPKGNCLESQECCAVLCESNRDHCYRAQCYETSRLLAGALQLAEKQWSVSFQSRLGRTKWIEPYTDQVLDGLAARGVKSLAIVCPSFTADCLETLEEIGLRAREQFLARGGSELILVPCLNSETSWAHAVCDLLL